MAFSLTISSILLFALSFNQNYVEGATPSAPRWPNQFSQNLTDANTWLTGTHKTRGSFYYDFTNEKYRIDRDNGRYDRYCGTNGVTYQFINTPCSHIVVDGNRFLYYPEKNDCCYCCNAAQGCGILKPDWLSDAVFKGNVTVKLNDGSEVNAYKWQKDGVQSNFYYETTEANPEDRVMLKIDQQPNEVQLYDDSRSLSVDSRKLELPSICDVKKSCSTASVCTLLSSKKVHF